MRYSGSPLPYSFSEKDHKKGTWLVEIGADGKASAEWVPAPGYRRLAALAGRIDDLLTSREHDGRESDFVAVTLTDTARPEGAMERLRARFPHILTLEFKPEGVTADPRSYGQKVKGRDDLTVAAEFVRHVRNTDATGPERELLAAAFTAARDRSRQRRASADAPAPAPGDGLRRVRRDRAGRLRRPGGPVPAARRDRRGQDHAARRDRVRPVRPGPRGTRHRQAAALRPRRAAHRDRGRA